MASATLLNSMNYDMTMEQSDKTGFNPLDIIKGVGYTAAGVATSAVTSFVNTGVSIANLIREDDYEYVDTGEWVNAWAGGGAQDFYEDHEALIDLGGLIGGSLIPGTAAVKALRVMQPKVSKGLASFAAGTESKFGSLATGLGKVIMPERALKNITVGVRKGNFDSFKFKDYFKLGKESFHQNILEAAVYETATVLTMAKNSTLSSEDLDYFESVRTNVDSIMFGTALGGAFGGLVGLAGSTKKAKDLLRQVQVEELNPYAVTSYKFSDSSIVGDKVSNAVDEMQNAQQSVTNLKNQIFELETADELDDIAISLAKKKLSLAEGRVTQTKNTTDIMLADLVQDQALRGDVKEFFSSLEADKVYDIVAGARKVGAIPTKGIVQDPVIKFALDFDPKITEKTFGGQLVKRNRILEIDKETLKAMDPDDVYKMFDSGYSNIAARDAMAAIKKSKAGEALDKDFVNFKQAEYGNLIQQQTDLFAEIDKLRAIPDPTDADIAKLEAIAIQEAGISETLGRLERPDEMMRKMFTLFNDVSESGSVMKMQEIRKLYPAATNAFEKSGGLRRMFGPSNALIDLEKGVAVRELSVVPTARDLGEIEVKGNSISVAGGKKNYEINSTREVIDMENIEATARYALAEAEPEKLLKDYFGKANTKVIGTFDFPRAYAAMRLMKEAPGNSKLKFKFTNVEGQNVDIKNFKEFAKELTKAKRAAVSKMKYSLTRTQMARVLDVDDSWVTGSYAVASEVDFSKIFRSLPSELDGKVLPKKFDKPKYLRVQYDRSFENEAEITGRLMAEKRMLEDLKSAREDMLGHFGEDAEMMMVTLRPDQITGVDSGSGILASDQAEYGLEAAKAMGATLNKRHNQRAVDIRKAYTDTALGVSEIPAGQTKAPGIAELGVITNLNRQQKMYFVDNAFDLVNKEIVRLNPTKLMQLLEVRPDFKTKLASAVSKVSGIKDRAGLVHKDLVDEVKNIINTLDASIVDELTEETVQQLDTMIGSMSMKLAENTSLSKLKSAQRLSYEIDNDSVSEFVRQYVKRNDADMNTRRNIAKHRGDVISYESGMFYAPPIDTSKYSHVATVKFMDSEKIYGSKNMGVIVANNQKDLMDKIRVAKESLGGEDKVIIRTLESQEDRFKALGEYDADMAITENVVESTMTNKGVLWDVTDEYNENIVANYLNAEIKRGDNLDRAALGVMAAREIETLRSMEKIYNPKGAISKSTRKADTEAWGKQIKTMMNVHHEGQYEWYISAQQKVADAALKAFGTAKSMFQRADPEKLATEYQAIDKYLERTGMPRPYTEAADYLKRNTNLPVQNLDGIISGLNSAAATIMLRLDQTQSLVNALSMPIMLAPEMQKLKQYVSAANLKKLDELTTTTIEKGVKEPTNMKLAMGAVQEFFTGNGAKGRKELVEEFRQHGIVRNALHEMQSAIDGLTVTPNMTEGMVKKGLKTAVKPVTALADYSEEFVKFVAGRSAQKVLELADGIPEKDKWAIIRNFVDKVHGNYTASQRPTLFKGFAGQAIGLFQTYQFNLYQRLFSHLGEDSKKLAMTMIGTQAGIFGAQSLPGFQLLNDHIAKQNEDYRNIYSFAKDELGDNGSEWFIYGTGSNMFKPIPGLGGIDLFSRGDLTPRTPILLPTSLNEIPVVSMTKKAMTSFLGAMKNSMQAIGAGEPEALGTIWMEGLAHNGLNRPLAGIAQMALDYRTTNQGKLLMTYDSSDNKAWTVATKAIGAKTIDEAIAVQQYYKALKYRTQRYEKLDRLGRSFRDIIRSNDGIVGEEYEHFRREYIANGGNGESYKRWMQNQVAGANESIINQLQESNTTPEGRYLQGVLGMEIDEF